MTRIPAVLARAAFVLAVTSLVAGGAQAQTIKREAARRIDSVAGVDSFRAYCAVCHGEDARGKGPAAAALKTVPADLTTLARRNGGQFSPMDVESFILGKNERMAPSHGSREMPIWGPVFRDLAVDQQTMTLRVNNLVGYLKSIQAK